VSRPDAGGARPGRVRPGPQTLIHTNKSPDPHGCSLSGGSPGVPVGRYSLEWGVSEAVIQAAFLIAVSLGKGGMR
jgi:hypothetical protein